MSADMPQEGEVSEPHKDHDLGARDGESWVQGLSVQVDNPVCLAFLMCCAGGVVGPAWVGTQQPTEKPFLPPKTSTNPPVFYVFDNASNGFFLLKN